MGVRVLAASDKFKGTVSAADVCAAIGHACWDLGLDCVELPLADGGEGTLEILGGTNMHTWVTGPLGDPVLAHWRFSRDVAVIEMARASGLTLVGGATKNDALAASTQGTGELIDSALDLGARKIIVCLGGSATTDGGYGALRAISAPARLKALEFIVACDVETPFLEAARVFAPQKGATPAQVALLSGRLERLADTYRSEYGVDVTGLAGAGAAGGLAGGLAALGAKLMPGFDVVAEETNFDEAIESCDVVVTGEGRLDDTSFAGKVVGEVAAWGHSLSKPVHAIVGSVDPDIDPAYLEQLATSDLSATFTREMSMREPLRCIEDAAREALRRYC